MRNSFIGFGENPSQIPSIMMFIRKKMPDDDDD